MKHGKAKCIFFILAFFILLQFSEAEAYGPIVKTKKEREAPFAYRQKKALKEAEELFLKGDYSGVVKICDDILYLAQRGSLQERYMDELYYYAGISSLKLNNISKAKLYLSKLISDYKNSALFLDACLALAEVYFIEGEYDKADELLTHYVKAYPADLSITQAYLRLGQIAQKRGRWEEARFYFDKIKKDFPLSFEATYVPSVFNEEGGFFTVQVGSFNDLQNATKLKKALEKKGYPSYVVEMRNTKSTFYRVRVGRLKSRLEAEYLADKLRREGFEIKIYP